MSRRREIKKELNSMLRQGVDLNTINVRAKELGLSINLRLTGEAVEFGGFRLPDPDTNKFWSDFNDRSEVIRTAIAVGARVRHWGGTGEIKKISLVIALDVTRAMTTDDDDDFYW